MVKGYMDALPQYSQVGIPAECIEKISEYVNSWELAALPCGKYVIDGERQGREQIWVTEQPLLTPDTEYDPKADIRFWKAGKASLLDLHAGELVILLPGEAHKPCVRSGDVGKVKKAVFKIAL